MSDPIFDNNGKHIARRIGNEVVSPDGKKSYDVDRVGNLVDKKSGAIVAHLIPVGQCLPDGRPSPGQDIF
jgi:hypothetical protein